MIGSTTDSDGNYFISNIPVGKYLIRVEYLGFETQTKEIYISEKDISVDDSDLSSTFSDKIGVAEKNKVALIKGNEIKGFNFYLKTKALDLE